MSTSSTNRTPNAIGRRPYATAVGTTTTTTITMPTYNVTTTVGHEQLTADRYGQDKDTRDRYFYNRSADDPVAEVSGRHFVALEVVA